MVCQSRRDDVHLGRKHPFSRRYLVRLFSSFQLEVPVEMRAVLTRLGPDKAHSASGTLLTAVQANYDHVLEPSRVHTHKHTRTQLNHRSIQASEELTLTLVDHWVRV